MCKDIVEVATGQEQHPANGSSRRFSVTPLLNPRISSQSSIVPVAPERSAAVQIISNAVISPMEVRLAPRTIVEAPDT